MLQLPRVTEMWGLTWYVSVAVLKGMEVVHEFFDWDLKGLKQASVFKEPVRNLRHRDENVHKHEITNSVDDRFSSVTLMRSPD